MILLEFTIKPLGGFGTPIKGDTIFGQICCEICYNPKLAKKKLPELIKIYPERPFLVISSGILKIKNNGKYFYILKRPDVPLEFLGQEQKETKEIKSHTRAIIDNIIRPFKLTDLKLYKDEEIITEFFGTQTYKWEVKRLTFSETQMRNQINRLSSTTSKPPFTPYPISKYFFYPGLELALLACLDEELMDLEGLITAIKSIGSTGFGMDSSVGYGRFEVLSVQELEWQPNKATKAIYLLSPFVPPKPFEGELYFTPFVRFGKHGRAFSKGRPFKNPVLMADEAAVAVLRDNYTLEVPYFGRPALNISKACPESLAQGYAPYIPLVWSEP